MNPQDMGQGMGPGIPSMPPQGGQGGQEQVPPPELLAQLAQQAQTLDPMSLGLIVFHALTQADLPLNMQGLNNLAGPGTPTVPVQPPQIQNPPAF